MTLGGAALVALLAVPVIGFVAYAGHDRIDLIDDSEVIEALEPTCDDLAAVVDTIGTEPLEPAALRRLSEAARSIPTAVDQLPTELAEDDRPVVGWGADWTILLDRVDEYVKQVEAGGAAVFDLPTTSDGLSIVGRMDAASPADGCDVPEAFVALDPNPPPRPSPDRSAS